MRKEPPPATELSAPPTAPARKRGCHERRTHRERSRNAARSAGCGAQSMVSTETAERLGAGRARGAPERVLGHGDGGVGVAGAPLGVDDLDVRRGAGAEADVRDLTTCCAWSAAARALAGRARRWRSPRAPPAPATRPASIGARQVRARHVRSRLALHLQRRALPAVEDRHVRPAAAARQLFAGRKNCAGYRLAAGTARRRVGHQSFELSRTTRSAACCSAGEQLQVGAKLQQRRQPRGASALGRHVERRLVRARRPGRRRRSARRAPPARGRARAAPTRRAPRRSTTAAAPAARSAGCRIPAARAACARSKCAFATSRARGRRRPRAAAR